MSLALFDEVSSPLKAKPTTGKRWHCEGCGKVQWGSAPRTKVKNCFDCREAAKPLVDRPCIECGEPAMKRSPRCKDCREVRAAEKRSESAKRYKAKYPDRVKEGYRRWRSSPAGKANKKKWKTENRAKLNVSEKIYRAKYRAGLSGERKENFEKKARERWDRYIKRMSAEKRAHRAMVQAIWWKKNRKKAREYYLKSKARRKAGT